MNRVMLLLLMTVTILVAAVYFKTPVVLVYAVECIEHDSGLGHG